MGRWTSHYCWAERFRHPEVVFKLYFIGKHSDGIHTITYDSIMKFDVDIQNDLYGNIVLLREKILCMDWWFNSFFFIYIPTNCSQKMLLIWSNTLFYNDVHMFINLTPTF